MSTVSSLDENTKMTVCKWTISPKYVRKFKTLSIGKYIKSDYFVSSNKLKWYLKCYTNGDCQQSGDCCNLYLKLSSLPNECESIIIYYFLYCEQTHSCFESIVEFKRGGYWGWPDRTQLSQELASHQNISFLCGIKILKVITKSNKKSYECPLSLNEIPQKAEMIWKLDKNMMNFCKNIHWGKRISSPTLLNNNNMFGIQCCPNGEDKKEQDNIGLYLNIRSFPMGVHSMKIAYTIQSKQLDKIWSHTDIFSYSDYCYGNPQFCSSNKLISHSALEIVVNTEILQCYDKDGEIIKNIKYNNILTPSDDLKQSDKQHEMDEEKKNNLIEQYNIRDGRGLALIICVSDYKNKANLYGTRNDKELMKNLFETQYKYKVMYNEKGIVTYDDFDQYINRARGELYQNAAKYDSFILIFSGHGNQKSIYLSDGHKYDRVDIYKFFNGLSCKPFSKKPKFLIFDACKGTEEAPQIRSKGITKCCEYPNHPDDNIVVFNANSDGYESYDTETGGVLIRSFHNVLKRNQSKICLDDLSKCVEMQMKIYCDNIGKMQTLEKVERGIKKQIFFCTPTKHQYVASKGYVEDDSDDEDEQYSTESELNVLLTQVCNELCMGLNNKACDELERKFQIYQKSINQNGWQYIKDINNDILASIIQNQDHLKPIQAKINAHKSQK